MNARNAPATEWRSSRCRSAPASPRNAAEAGQVRREGYRAAEDLRVRPVAESHVNPAVIDRNTRNIRSTGIRRGGTHSRLNSVSRWLPGLVKSINDGRFCRGRQVDAFCNLRTDRIGLVGRHRERCQDADDRNDYHQLNEGEPFMDGFHLCALEAAKRMHFSVSALVSRQYAADACD